MTELRRPSLDEVIQFGFEIPTTEIHHFIGNKEVYEKVMRESRVRTNFQALLEHSSWNATHQARVAEIVGFLSVFTNLSSEQLPSLYRAAILHDIGKLDIPTQILNKKVSKGELPRGEREILARHTEFGYKRLIEIDVVAAELARRHHSYDDIYEFEPGSPMSEGLNILMISDVVDGLLKVRPYKPAYSVNEINSDRILSKFDQRLVEMAKVLSSYQSQNDSDLNELLQRPGNFDTMS